MSVLFSPIEIGTMKLKNRVVMPAMASGFACEEGKVKQKHHDYYLARAKAGTGLIILEHAYVEKNGRAKPDQLSIADDRVVAGLRRLVKEINEAGAHAAIQLAHAGSKSSEPTLVGPSPLPHPVDGNVARELTQADLKDLVIHYRKAAKRAEEAGFSALEVHGAHAFLLNQFLSPLTNIRKDKYGGSPENRMRFPLEVVQGILQEIKGEIPVFYRLGADDMMEGGFTLREAVVFARELEKVGVSLIDVSGGMCGSRPAGAPPAYFAMHSEAVRNAVSVPVICTGGIRDARLAEELLVNGKADLIGIGREMLKDPLWTSKARLQLEGESI